MGTDEAFAKRWRAHPVWLCIIWHYFSCLLNRCIGGKDYLWQAGTPSEAREDLQKEETTAYRIWVVTGAVLQGARKKSQALGKREIQAFFLYHLRGDWLEFVVIKIAMKNWWTEREEWTMLLQGQAGREDICSQPFSSLFCPTTQTQSFQFLKLAVLAI